MPNTKAPTNLIVVCCHGIWQGGPTGGAAESEWLIADFQRGETATFAQHAEAGVQCLAKAGDDSVLVFSGYDYVNFVLLPRKDV